MSTFESPVNETWKKAATRAAMHIPADNRMEHRWGNRRPCRARVFISAGPGMAGMGGLRNVSMSGAFLETALPLPLFAQITVSVVLDDGSRCEEFSASVVRHDAQGAGIEWTDPVAGSICCALGCAAHCPFSESAA